MSDLLEVMRQCRSIRKYTGEAIPEEKMERILQAGLLAPTSMNRKPCEFYVVKDREKLAALAKAKKAAAGMIAECDAAIAVFADSEKADTWIEDASIALTYMQLMAAEQGVGSCWVQMHLRASEDGKDAEANVREILGVDEPFRIVGILSLGMPAAVPAPYELDQLDRGKIH